MQGYYRVQREGHYLYFITSTIVDWLPLFSFDGTCDILLDGFTYCREQKGLLLHAYVIMPTHFHAIVSSEPQTKLPGIMRDFKRYTSGAITRRLASDGEQSLLRIMAKIASTSRGNVNYKVWQNGYRPIAIFSHSFLRQKLNYIHNNPVRKGWVECAEEWRYSSAGLYVRGERGVLEIDRLAGF